MTRKIKIILLLTSVFTFGLSFGQSITKKDLCDKLSIRFLADSVKSGDTIIIKKGEKNNNFYFKSNGDLKEHTWYAKCGNKFFLDYFAAKAPKWESIGIWTLKNEDNRIVLEMIINEKPFYFQYISRQDRKYKFVFLE